MANDLSAEELERARRARLIDEARATVERLKDIKKYREEVESLPGPEVARRLLPAAADDAIERWARDADERERQRKAAERELRREARRDRIVRKRHEGDQPAAATRASEDWNDWCDARIQAALDCERDALASGFGQAIAKMLADERKDVMRKVRDEIRDLKIEIAKLGSEAAELRAASPSIAARLSTCLRGA